MNFYFENIKNVQTHTCGVFPPTFDNFFMASTLKTHTHAYNMNQRREKEKKGGNQWNTNRRYVLGSSGQISTDLLHLELDGGAHGVHLALEVVSRVDEGGELTRLGQAGAQQTRDLKDAMHVKNSHMGEKCKGRR